MPLWLEVLLLLEVSFLLEASFLLEVLPLEEELPSFLEELPFLLEELFFLLELSLEELALWLVVGFFPALPAFLLLPQPANREKESSIARTNAPIRIRLFLNLRVVIKKHILVRLVLPSGILFPLTMPILTGGS